MAMAICFKCGSSKSGALIGCRSCNAAPRTNSEDAVSLALSDHLSSKDQLAQYSYELRNGLKLSVPREALVQAFNALKDPQLLAMLGAQSAAAAPAPSAPSATRQSPPVPSAAPPSPPIGPERRLTKTALHQSPFAILGVTTRDDRRRIVELAEEKSLELDHDVCQKARSDLTNPRTRLSAEMAWLPGVSPRKSGLLLAALLNDPMSIREESSLPTLAHLNLLAAALDAVDAKHDVDDFVSFVHEIADLSEQLKFDEVVRDINEDRTVSGFPELTAIDQIEGELSERKRYFRNALKNALESLPAANLVKAMTEVVDLATRGGEDHAPELIDELVDLYEQETQGVLDKAATNVHTLIESARKSVDSGEQAVKPFIDRIHSAARDWDRIAQPIQLSCKARGIDHGPSFDLAFSIRDLAVFLFKEHDMLAQSLRLTTLLQELFAEVPEFVERANEDADAITEIFQNRKQAEAKREANKREWDQEITYRVELGVIFKDVLSISPSGVSFKKKHYKLDDVTRVYWGATRNSTNGVYTGTTYSIGFGDNGSGAFVETSKEDVFDNFVNRLWKAVGVRLMVELLVSLQDGRAMQIGNAWLHDDGVTFKKKKLFGAAEDLPRSWSQIHTWNSNGNFCIGATDEKKVFVALSYIHSANTHVFEQVLGMAFKKPGMTRLSELLG